MLPVTFNVRQAGCCMTAARIIAGKLLKEGKSPVVVEGWIQFVDEEHRGADLRFAHTWVELDGELLDPTLEQFSEYLDFYSFEREYQEVLPASDYLNRAESPVLPRRVAREGQGRGWIAPSA